MPSRKVLEIIEPQTVIEGAGVKLERSIANKTLNYLNPFLLFDHFGSDNPADYIEQALRDLRNGTFVL